jgi:hypothetical protein
MSNTIAGEYTGQQLITYIIIPALTVFTICYALIFTRLSYAEWIFWILIATVIFTGMRTITFDFPDLQILAPDNVSPLRYITDKLNFRNSDELEYSFMARKADGGQCSVRGVMLGKGVHSSDPPVYSGDCDAESLPLS